MPYSYRLPKIQEIVLQFGCWLWLKPTSNKTRLGTRFPYGILGNTRVNWYEYWVPTVPWYEWDSNVARVCTNKVRIYSVKQGLSRFEHDLQTIFTQLSDSSKYGLVRSCTIKHDFYSIYWTFTNVNFTIYVW